MIRAAEMSLIKQAMLKQLDSAFRQTYNQTLSEVLKELRMRSVLSQPDPTPDAVFSILLEAHVLSLKPPASAKRLRDALERLVQGKYGFCTRCARELPMDLLLKDPTEPACPLCQQGSVA